MVSIVDYKSFVVISNEFAKKNQDVLPEPFRGGLTTVPALRPVGHGIMESWNHGMGRRRGWGMDCLLKTFKNRCGNEHVIFQESKFFLTFPKIPA